MTASRHFILSFFAPPIAAAVACYFFYLCNFWMELRDGALMTGLLVTFVLVLIAGRWVVRTFIAVKCPFCGGNTFEMEGRANRFMCRVCGRDH